MCVLMHMLADSVHTDAQAIALTENVLSEYATEEPSSSQPPEEAAAASRKRRSRFEPLTADAEAFNPILPVDLVTQIAYAKARSALQGQGPPSWAVGADCVARYSDGQWQNAHIQSLSPEGLFVVLFDRSQAVEAVAPMDCKPRDLTVRCVQCGRFRRNIT